MTRTALHGRDASPTLTALGTKVWAYTYDTSERKDSIRYKDGVTSSRKM